MIDMAERKVLPQISKSEFESHRDLYPGKNYNEYLEFMEETRLEDYQAYRFYSGGYRNLTDEETEAYYNSLEL